MAFVFAPPGNPNRSLGIFRGDFTIWFKYFFSGFGNKIKGMNFFSHKQPVPFDGFI